MEACFPSTHPEAVSSDRVEGGSVAVALPVEKRLGCTRRPRPPNLLAPDRVGDGMQGQGSGERRARENFSGRAVFARVPPSTFKRKYYQ